MYSFITLVCIILCIMLDFLSVFTIRLSFSTPADLSISNNHLKAGISYIRTKWRFHDISVSSLYASFLDSFSPILQVLWLQISQVTTYSSSNVVLNIVHAKILDNFSFQLNKMPSQSNFSFCCLVLYNEWMEL